MNLVYSLDKEFHKSQSLDHGIYRFKFHWGIDEVLGFAVKETINRDGGFLDKYSIGYDFELDGLNPEFGWVKRSGGLMPGIILADRAPTNSEEMNVNKHFTDFGGKIGKLSMIVSKNYLHYDENSDESKVKEFLSKGYAWVEFIDI